MPRAILTPAHRYPSTTVIDPLLFTPTLASVSASNAVLTTGSGYVEWGYSATTAGSGYAALVISTATPWDFSQSPLLGFEFGSLESNLPGYLASAAGSRIRILLGTTQGSLGADYYDFNTQLSGLAKDGRFVYSQLKSAATVGGSPSWSNIRRIEIRLTSDSWPSGHKLRLYSVLANMRVRPKVVISFDDNNNSVLTNGYPLMSAAGIPGTLYINSDDIGTGSKLTIAELNSLYSAGWDISNHTASHMACCFRIGPSITQVGGVCTATYDANVWLPTINPGQNIIMYGADPYEYSGPKTITAVGAGTFSYSVPSTYPSSAGIQSFIPIGWYDAVIESIEKCQRVIESNGWGRGLKHFCYPYGNYNDDVISILRSMGFVTARATGGMAHTPFSNCIVAGSPEIDAWRLPTFPMGSGTTGAQILTAVDRAIQYNATLFVYGHHVGSGGDITTVEFGNFITGLKQRVDWGLVDVMTISKWYDSVSRPEGWRAAN
jgi:peptidoglycan/xylan/chitin deacetylase (PgdA/CDA1 family)